MEKKPCIVCSKLITVSNMARHVKTRHVFCQVCQTVSSAKKHSCFRATAGGDLFSQYTAIWLPVLLKKEVVMRNQNHCPLVRFSVNETLPDLPLVNLNPVPTEDGVSRIFQSWIRTKKYENCLTYCGLSTFLDGGTHQCCSLLPQQQLLDFFFLCCKENGIVVYERGSKEERDILFKFIKAVFCQEGIVL